MTCGRCKRDDRGPPPPFRPMGNAKGEVIRACSVCFQPAQSEGWMELPPHPAFHDALEIRTDAVVAVRTFREQGDKSPQFRAAMKLLEKALKLEPAAKTA